MNASRRNFLTGGVAAAAASAFAPTLRAQDDACGVKPSRFDPTPTIAVSLKATFESLSSCGTGAFARLRCSRQKRLGGMTRLDGFVADPASRDVILWGLKEEGAPPLFLDDFVVAMRAAAGRYIGRPGQPGYNLAPAISIDPDPDVFRRLRDLDWDLPDFDAKFAEMCAYPQVVRVDGMPRHTRVAHVLVDADYRMKQVGQGTMKIPIDSPFPSHNELKRKFDAVARKRGTSDLKGSNTRFWFSPGKFDYQVSPSGDTGFLETAQVILQDEDEHLTSSGLVASGSVNIFTRAFTCAWTERMEDTYKAEPIWRDMHNMFRHFAVARILADHRVLEQARFDSRLLLDSHVVEAVKLWETLPGLGVVYRDDGAMSWVCGGVSLGFGSALEARVSRRSEAASQVMSRRPSSNATAWTIAYSP